MVIHVLGEKTLIYTCSQLWSTFKESNNTKYSVEKHHVNINMKIRKVCVCVRVSVTSGVRICDEDEFKQEAAGEDERTQSNGMEEETKKFGRR